MSGRTWKIAGINFDHMHMGDNLRSLALAFAAMKSADTGRPQTPGKVGKAPA